MVPMQLHRTSEPVFIQRGNPCSSRRSVPAEGERRMFASVRKYKVRRGSVEGLARRVQADFVPLVRQMEGFQSYYLLHGGPDLLSLSASSIAPRHRLLRTKRPPIG